MNALVVVSFLAIVSSVYAQTNYVCIQCTTNQTTNCNDPITATTNTSLIAAQMTCSTTGVCFKLQTMTNGVQQTQRGCTTSYSGSACLAPGISFLGYTASAASCYCTGSYCNAASSLTPAGLTSALVVIAASMFAKLFA
jgi:hypothetical protein